jgi:hypothetical protein
MIVTDSRTKAIAIPHDPAVYFIKLQHSFKQQLGGEHYIMRCNKLKAGLYLARIPRESSTGTGV